MSRLPSTPPSDPETESMLAAADSMGFANVIRALAHHPGAVAAVGQLATIGYFALPPERRELAYLTASRANTCHY